MRYKIKSTTNMYLQVELEYEGVETTLLLPRPSFDATLIRNLALHTGHNALRIVESLEAVFLEGFMKHLSSRLQYWWRWWRTNWKQVATRDYGPAEYNAYMAAFPINEVLGTFLPKLQGSGPDSNTRRALMKALSEYSNGTQVSTPISDSDEEV